MESHSNNPEKKLSGKDNTMANSTALILKNSFKNYRDSSGQKTAIVPCKDKSTLNVLNILTHLWKCCTS